MTSYQKLEARFLQLSRLENARAILQWDEAVMMPSGSSDSRNQSLAELAGVIQGLATGTEIGDWLGQAESARDAGDWERANLREMKRIYTAQTAIPPELNQKLVMARMNCEQKWRTMRSANDWSGFMPHLQEVLNLTREAVQGLSKVMGLSMYDTALSEYSNGLSTKVVETLFTEIKSFLPSLIAEIAEKQKSEKVLQPQGTFPMSAQKALGQDLMKAVGFSFDNGRLDESHHPFCGGTPRDVRITTRYNEREFVSALMGVLHETGHAMYEQHLPLRWSGQPVGNAAGMAVHESQSLLMEMQVCRSPEFLDFAAPLILKHLGPHVSNPESLEAGNLTRLVTRVKPGYIRVDADEVTYPAHVILRFELEHAMLEGSLALKDLPFEWNKKMQAYLGLGTEGNFKDGCMQDVHWPAGLFGYFPAYTFGAVIAAHLFATIQQKNPTARTDIGRGNFKTVQNWLDQNIWSQGSRLTTLDLVKEAAGPLTAQAFRTHLQTRYL
jgi:carboxypeptidase Taq